VYRSFFEPLVESLRADRMDLDLLAQIRRRRELALPMLEHPAVRDKVLHQFVVGLLFAAHLLMAEPRPQRLGRSGMESDVGSPVDRRISLV